MNNNYTSYKLFDKKWAKDIPEHWNFLRLKSIFQLRKERNNPVKTENILSLTAKQGVVPVSEKTDVGGNKPKEDLTLYNLAYKDDLLVNCMNVVSGAAGVSKYYGAISPVYYALYLRNKDNIWYYHYIFRLMSFQRSLLGLGKGILMHESESGKLNTVRMRISMDYLGNVLLPVPPRDEQDQIVRFLDWKVSSINRLINIKKKEISKLEELKRTKIATIVMGKLADEQKETAISWVHSIPTHWQEASLIQVAEEQLIKNVGLTEKNLLSLSYGKIINKDIEATEGLLPASFESYQIVNDGNIILRLTDLQNDHRSLRTGLVTQKGIITSAYTCLKTRGSVLPEYLQLQLHIADLCKVFYGMGGGVRQSIGFKEIRKLIIALPSLEEQEEIVEVVHKIENPINELIKKYKDFILLLENLKSRIISDAVTGQIDVRDVKIPSFDMVEEYVEDEMLEDNNETEESGAVE